MHCQSSSGFSHHGLQLTDWSRDAAKHLLTVPRNQQLGSLDGAQTWFLARAPINNKTPAQCAGVVLCIKTVDRYGARSQVVTLVLKGYQPGSQSNTPE